jgi:DNA-binding transcriptional ArsR family regulator
MAKQTNGLNIDEVLLKKGALVLRAVNHKLRQQILQQIHKKGRISVTELYIKLRLEQSVASQHLAILRQTGFVTTQREGKQIFYSVDYKRLEEVQTLAGKLLQNTK